MNFDWLHRLDSPLGPIQVVLNKAGALVYLGFADHEPRERLMLWLADQAEAWSCDRLLLQELHTQLADYFAGRRHDFDHPLDLRGTPFQRRVWAELQGIPFGTAISYLELARRLGDPKLTRAVGTANGANPVSILVPCHRVIGSNGQLTGYAGGLVRKQALLELERHPLA